MQKFRKAGLIFLAAFSAFILFTAENSEASSNGMIYGKLAAKDASALKDAKIVLGIISGNETVQLSEKNANQNGSYSFENLETNRTYLLKVYYKGIEYSNSAELKNEGEQKKVDFTLYEVTQEDTAATIEMHHIIIAPKEGMLDVTEYLYYKNAGEEIINTTQLYITLPAERKAIATSLMECCFTQYGDYATFDPMQPLKPGDISEVALNYKIPVNSTEIVFERKVKYPTRELLIFAAPKNNTIIEAVERVSFQGEASIEGETYKVFYAANLERESVPKIRFANLKIMELNPEISADSNNKTLIRNALIIAGVFLILAGSFYTYRKFKEEKS